jgi:hypothetical protein
MINKKGQQKEMERIRAVRAKEALGSDEKTANGANGVHA